MQRQKILAIIPARSGSKRIPSKNKRLFAGKPLIGHTIHQALGLKIFDRVILDTDSAEIATIAQRYGAEVPFLRPVRLAGDKSLVADSALNILKKLDQNESYKPDYVALLQPTSPLREKADILKCVRKIREKNTDAVLTVCSTHPLLYNLSKNGNLVLANIPKVAPKFIQGKRLKGFQMQAFPPGYKLNGCFVYLIKYNVFIKAKTFFPKKTKAVIVDAWRSVDLDTPEDFVLAEFIYNHTHEIKNRIKNFPIC